MNGLQALDTWRSFYDQPTAPKLGLLNSIMSVGSIVALPFVPYTADLLGRRTGVMIGCCIMILGVVIQTLGFTFAMLVGARFFIGFGVAIAHGSAPLLITELVHPQHRAVYTAVYNTTWYVGSFVAAWLTYGTNNLKSNWSWRAPALVQIFPSLLQIIFIWFVPESPRWLISRGKNEDALKILADAHAEGNEKDEVVQLEYQEIRQTLKLEREFEGNAWSELWRTPGNRHRLLILISIGFFSQWSGNGLVSYYIHFVLDQVKILNSDTQLLINGVLQGVNMIVAIGTCFFVEKIGRRVLFLTSTSGMLVIFISWTICAAEFALHQTKAAKYGVIVMIFIYYMFYNIAFAGLLVGYSVEILPFNIRAKGITIMFLSIDIALFFNQYVNPIAMSRLDWKYYIVYDVWLLFEVIVVYRYYIETRNTPLEEIVKHFDGEGAVLGGPSATMKSKQLAAEIDMVCPIPAPPGAIWNEKPNSSIA